MPRTRPDPPVCPKTVENIYVDYLHAAHTFAHKKKCGVHTRAKPTSTPWNRSRGTLRGATLVTKMAPPGVPVLWAEKKHGATRFLAWTAAPVEKVGSAMIHRQVRNDKPSASPPLTSVLPDSQTARQTEPDRLRETRTQRQSDRETDMQLKKEI